MSVAQQSTPFFYSELASEPDMADLIALFVDEMPARIDALLRCWDQQNWDDLGRLAHQLKGASGSYGFPQLTPCAQRLERSAKTHDVEQIKAQLDELVSLCRRLRPGTPEA